MLHHSQTVLVASVSVLLGDEVLMIQENKAQVRNKWNFPSGRIEHGEDILMAACREVKEETGFDVRLIHTTGVYQFVSSANAQVILFHFTGEIIGGELKLEDGEIKAGRWVPLSEVAAMADDELREPELIKQIAAKLSNHNHTQMVHAASLFTNLS